MEELVTEHITNVTDTVIQEEDNPNGLEIPLYIYIVASFVNGVIFLSGTFGNCLVIIVVITVRNMRTSTNLFLFSLSIADVLVLLVCQPAGLLEFFGKDRWYLGKAMCKMVPLLENGVLHVSILTMLAVTVERYNALCRPFKHRTTSTISTTIKIIVSIWLVGIILTLPFLIMTEHEDAHFYDGTPIKVCRTKVDQPWRFSYIIFVFVTFFALPFFILVVLYSLIIKQLMSDKLQSLVQNDRSAFKAIQSRKQVIRMLVFIIVLFFITLFPIRVMTLWLIFTPSQTVTSIGLEAYLNLIMWTRLLMYVNSAGNPIIYSLTSTKFKVAFKAVLRRTDIHSRGSISSTRCGSNLQYRTRLGSYVTVPMTHMSDSRMSSVRSKLSQKSSSDSITGQRFSTRLHY